jgi:hypothetical protein
MIETAMIEFARNAGSFDVLPMPMLECLLFDELSLVVVRPLAEYCHLSALEMIMNATVESVWRSS